jgi:hypothetical protein
MAANQKHGKGKYAYQAKKAGKQMERPATAVQSVVSDSGKNANDTTGIVKRDNGVTLAKNNTAVMPVNIGKIDLAYEVKRIAIIAAVIIALLIILFIVLK